jgi:hypothetical protein
MIGRMKATVVGWLVGRGMQSVVAVSELDRQAKRDIVETVVQTVKNMVQGKHTIKTEPVLFGGVVTIAVALAAAFGLDLTVEELTVTVSTVIAIVSFVQRRFVSPVRGEGSPQKGSQFPRES